MDTVDRQKKLINPLCLQNLNVKILFCEAYPDEKDMLFYRWSATITFLCSFALGVILGVFIHPKDFISLLLLTFIYLASCALFIEIFFTAGEKKGNIFLALVSFWGIVLGFTAGWGLDVWKIIVF